MRITTIAAISVLAATAVFAPASADARPYAYGGSFVFACDNGANYRLDSGPVTASGDVVTGFLSLAPRRHIPVRLIPMGVGYRYAGRGVWIDGIRDQALLYFRKDRPIACRVAST